MYKNKKLDNLQSIDGVEGEHYVTCKECGLKMNKISWTHLKYKHNLTLKQYDEKYNLKSVDRISKKVTSSVGVTLERLIALYGEDDGKLRWESYKEKQSKTNTFQYKKEKYGWTYEQFDAYNKSRAITLSNMIKKYGVTIGTQKYKKYCKIQKDVGCSLEYFVKKYGEADGKIKYENINKSKAITLSNMIKKYGEDIGTARYESFIKNLALNNSLMHEKMYSNNSQELFNSIYELLPVDKKNFIFYNNLNNEYIFISKEHNKAIFVDFYDRSTNKVIEFYGNYWHMNPKMYMENFINKTTNIMAKDKWLQDATRINIINEKYGCKTLIVWEDEYKNSSIEVIKKCLNFLLND